MVRLAIIIGLNLFLATGAVARPKEEDLTQAVQNGDRPAVVQALANGANINARDEFGKTALTTAIEAVDLFGLPDPSQADDESAVEMVRLLLAKGAKLEATGEHGFTPLIVAVDHGTNTGHTPHQFTVIKLLLERGAAVNAQDDNGMTALHFAAWRGYLDAVRLLREHGAKLDLHNRYGETALDIAGTNPVVTAQRRRELKALLAK